MRLATFLIGIGLLATQPALADTRIFLVASQPDGYGVDQCLANGDKCGATVAHAYCRSRQFQTASAFRKAENNDIVGAVQPSVGEACSASSCSGLVAITCVR